MNYFKLMFSPEELIYIVFEIDLLQTVKGVIARDILFVYVTKVCTLECVGVSIFECLCAFNICILFHLSGCSRGQAFTSVSPAELPACL